MMPVVTKGSCLVVKLWAVPVSDESSAYLADLATFAPPLHHGCSECAGIEINKPLMHDSCAFTDISAKPYSSGVRKPNARGYHVVRHFGEFVH